MQIGFPGSNPVDSAVYNRPSKSPAPASDEAPAFSLSFDDDRPAEPKARDDQRLVTSDPSRQPIEKSKDRRVGEPSRRTKSAKENEDKPKKDQPTAPVEVQGRQEIQPNKPNQAPATAGSQDAVEPTAEGNATAVETMMASAAGTMSKGESPIEKWMGQLVYQISLNEANANQTTDSNAQATVQSLAANPAVTNASQPAAPTVRAETQSVLELEAAVTAWTEGSESQSGSSQDSESQDQSQHHSTESLLNTHEQVTTIHAHGGDTFTLSPNESPAESTSATASTSREVLADRVAAPKTVSELALEVGSGSDVVRIQVQQNAETLRVSVHSPNAELAPRLTEALPDLLKQLDQKGFDARIVTAQPATPAPEIRTESSSHSNPGFDRQTRDSTPDHQHSRRRSRQQAWDDLVMQLHYE